VVYAAAREPDRADHGRWRRDRFRSPNTQLEADGITVGPAGALWLTERLADKVGRLTTAGRFTELPLPPFASGAWRPAGITAGPDGNVWISELLAKSIARITLDGVVTEFPVPSNASPTGVTAAPDGNIWFTEPVPAVVGRLDVGGPRQDENLRLVPVQQTPRDHRVGRIRDLGPDARAGGGQLGKCRTGPGDRDHRTTSLGERASEPTPQSLGCSAAS
jgi:streptogramin lyase